MNRNAIEETDKTVHGSERVRAGEGLHGSEAAWWRHAVIYQIYPRSFFDSTGNGTGDLPGIARKMDYIHSLGVDAIWISPFFKSPMKDFRYLDGAERLIPFEALAFDGSRLSAIGNPAARQGRIGGGSLVLPAHSVLIADFR